MTDWSERPWARTFDLIASEYGWTDEQILDLTLGRVRQIRDVIVTRQMEIWRRQARLEEAKLQTLVGAVYAAAGNKKGAASADRIRLIDDAVDEVKEPPSFGTVAAGFGSGAHDLFSQEDIERRAAELRAAS